MIMCPNESINVSTDKSNDSSTILPAVFIQESSTYLGKMVLLGLMSQSTPLAPVSHYRLPMPAFVWADAAKTSGCLEICNMLLDGAARYAKRGDHTGQSKVGLFFQQIPELIDCFLTAFSYRLFLTAFF